MIVFKLTLGVYEPGLSNPSCESAKVRIDKMLNKCCSNCNLNIKIDLLSVL